MSDYFPPGHRSGFRDDWEVRVRHPASARFHEILRELGALHDLKQLDYGTNQDPFANVRAAEEWGLPGYVGALVRLSDKVRRLQSLVRNGRLWNEPAEDSLRDIAVYAIIALVLLEESEARRVVAGEEPHGEREPAEPHGEHDHPDPAERGE